jgi:hypothetical protein
MKGFADLADLPEDDRIRVIGEYVERQGPGIVTGVVVDHDAGGYKARRYCVKLTERYKVRIIDMGPGPVARSTLIRVAQRGDA